jgi:hypothetical protein
MLDLDRNERGIDIHHIFPRKWCDEPGRQISPRIYDSIVNKTAISYKASRKIGGKAPSEYLAKIQNDPVVQLSDAAMDAILQTHCITPGFLRIDDFAGFLDDRRAILLRLVEQAMGKQAIVMNEPDVEDASDPEDGE